jgi:hypothetical protein
VKVKHGPATLTPDVATWNRNGRLQDGDGITVTYHYDNGRKHGEFVTKNRYDNGEEEEVINQ